MDNRSSIDDTKKRFALRVLEQRKRVSPGIDYDAPSDDVINLETNFVLAKMKNMTPEEATAFSAQTVAEAEATMIEAAEAVREAEAAEAEAQAVAAAFKKMKARNTKKRPVGEPGTSVSKQEERSSDCRCLLPSFY